MTYAVQKPRSAKVRLATVDIKGLPQTPPRPIQMPSLMAFLKGL